MDVTFLETEPFFVSPNTRRQGEISSDDQVSSSNPSLSPLSSSLFWEQTASPEVSHILKGHDQSILGEQGSTYQEMSDSTVSDLENLHMSSRGDYSPFWTHRKYRTTLYVPSTEKTDSSPYDIMYLVT